MECLSEAVSCIISPKMKVKSLRFGVVVVDLYTYLKILLVLPSWSRSCFILSLLFRSQGGNDKTDLPSH